MCGISGIFNFENQRPVDVELLRAVNAILVHRGPDDEGIYVNGPVGLGARRLSIIGLADGHQPLSNEDGSVWTVFNGEIYNFPELRAELRGRGHQFRTSTDTEILVHLYEEEGDGLVHRLNGMFAFALWDDRRRCLLLCRDRLGEKPLYYTVGNGRLLFASEIKAILKDPSVNRALRLEAIYDYLRFQYNPRHETVFRDIFRLEPGTMLVVSEDGISTRRYWEIPVKDHGGRSEQDYLAELDELLRDSVRRRLLSDVPLGAFLSGGVDSSTIVGLMAGLLDRPVKTFTVGFRVPGAFDETRHAETAAQQFGTEHYTLLVGSVDVERLLAKTVYHLDEPVADYAAIPTFILSEFARQHVKVVLTGEGADELFAGYDHYRVPSLLERYQRLPVTLRQWLDRVGAHLAPPKIAKALKAGTLGIEESYLFIKSVFRSDQLDPLLSESFRAELGTVGEQPNFARVFQRSQSLDPLNRYLIADLSTWLPEDLLMKVDKMSMSVGLEARAPFLDHRIVELLAAMPSTLKWHGGGKYLLKRVASGFVAEEIIRRPKHGFVLPLDRWFRIELREMATEALLGPRTTQRGFFNYRNVQRLWERYLAGDSERFMQIWTLLNFEIWCRVFLDGDWRP